MVLKCYVLGCEHVSLRNRCKFFRFPTTISERKKWSDRIPQRDQKPTAMSAVCSCHFKGGNNKNLPSIFLSAKAISTDPRVCTINTSEPSSTKPLPQEPSNALSDDSSERQSAETSPVNILSPVSSMEVETSDSLKPGGTPSSSDINSSLGGRVKVECSIIHTSSEITIRSPVVSSSSVSCMEVESSDSPTEFKTSPSSKTVSSSSFNPLELELSDSVSRSETNTTTSTVSSSLVSSIEVEQSDDLKRVEKKSSLSKIPSSCNSVALKAVNKILRETTKQSSVSSATPISGASIEQSKKPQQSPVSQPKLIKLMPSVPQRESDSSDVPSQIPEGSSLPPLTPSGWFVVGPDGKAQLILSQKSAPKGAKVMSTPILLAPRGVVMASSSTSVSKCEEVPSSSSQSADIGVEPVLRPEPSKNQVVILSHTQASKNKTVIAPGKQIVVTSASSQPPTYKVVTVSSSQPINHQSVTTVASRNEQSLTSCLQPPNSQGMIVTRASSLKTISVTSPVTKLQKSEVAKTPSKQVPKGRVVAISSIPKENKKVIKLVGQSQSTQSLKNEAIIVPSSQAQKRPEATISSPQPQKVQVVTELFAKKQKANETASPNIHMEEEEPTSSAQSLKGKVMILPNAPGLKTFGKAPPSNVPRTLVISNSRLQPPKLVCINSARASESKVTSSSNSQTQKGTVTPLAEGAVTQILEDTLVSAPKVAPSSVPKSPVVPILKGAAKPVPKDIVASPNRQTVQSQVAATPSVTLDKGQKVASESPDMLRNQLYILSENKWVPLPSSPAQKKIKVPATRNPGLLSPLAKKQNEAHTCNKEIQTDEGGHAELVEQLKEEMNELLEKYRAAQNKILLLDTRLCTTLRSEKELHDRLEQESHRLSFSHLSTMNGRIAFYTGLRTDTFRWLLDLFVEPITYRPGFGVIKIPKEDQLFITLVTLRLNRDNLELGDWFGVSKRTIYKVVWTWIDALYNNFFQLMKNIRSKQNLEDTLPLCFTPPPDCHMIFGCGDVLVQRSTRLRPATTTMKSLIGIAPNGLITYVTDLYPQSVHDKVIVRECKLADFLIAKDLVLVDDIKGLVPSGVRISSPAFQLENKKSFLRAEIAIDKCIQRIREYTILNSLPLCYTPWSSKIWQVCAALTNLRTKFCQKEQEVSVLESPEYEDQYFDCVVIDAKVTE